MMIIINHFMHNSVTTEGTNISLTAAMSQKCVFTQMFMNIEFLIDLAE